MTILEIIESGAGRFLRTEEYEKAGIELLENTPQEILDACIEMDERLKGTWNTTEEDDVLQKAFWDNFKSSDLNVVMQSRIGAKFLKQNRDLLE